MNYKLQHHKLLIMLKIHKGNQTHSDFYFWVTVCLFNDCWICSIMNNKKKMICDSWLFPSSVFLLPHSQSKRSAKENNIRHVLFKFKYSQSIKCSSFFLSSSFFFYFSYSLYYQNFSRSRCDIIFPYIIRSKYYKIKIFS